MNTSNSCLPASLPASQSVYLMPNLLVCSRCVVFSSPLSTTRHITFQSEARLREVGLGKLGSTVYKCRSLTPWSVSGGTSNDAGDWMPPPVHRPVAGNATLRAIGGHQKTRHALDWIARSFGRAVKLLPSPVPTTTRSPYCHPIYPTSGGILNSLR
jgi:hypothetical protein